MIADRTYPRISVVTPNYNQGEFIERTMLSVLEQNYPNLEYIIIDGASTDDSVHIIKKYENSLAYWKSEKDKGMYHAINKGLDRATGDIMCWINSDDILMESSLFKVAELFTIHNQLKWLQGKPTVIDEQGAFLKSPKAVGSPYHFYFGLHRKNYSFIQQESTFWHRSLWEKVGATLSLNYSMASDFDLWMRFFQYEKLYVTETKLGAFRIREGQKSSNQHQYISEADRSLRSHIKSLSCNKRFEIWRQSLVFRFLTKCRLTVCNRFRRNLLNRLMVSNRV